MTQLLLINFIIPKLVTSKGLKCHPKNYILGKINNLKEKQFFKEILSSSTCKRKIFLRNVLIDPLPFYFQILAFENKLISNSITPVYEKGFSTKSGLTVIDFEKGYGKKPQWGDFLIINYTIYLGLENKLKKIDSSFDRNEPFIFAHGENRIIEGIEEIVHNMKEGGRKRIIIPDYLGYTKINLGPLVPSQNQRIKLFRKNPINILSIKNPLIFDIELVEVKSLQKKKL
jgi:FKBP-type peptidyl-prolyl cis-trans isomerase FkpA